QLLTVDRLREVCGLLCEALGRRQTLASRFDRRMRSMLPTWFETICRELEDIDWPLTWIHADLWSPNIFIDGDHVSLVDLEDSYWGPPYLAMWRFFREISRRSQNEEATTSAVRDAYLAEWSSLVPEARMRRAIALLPWSGRMLRLLTLRHHHDREN